MSCTPSQLALATHPDKNPDNEEATRQFQQIGEAYHALATYLDKSSHRNEYADPFDAYDDDDDYEDYEDDESYTYIDLEDLRFYLLVIWHILLETCSSPRRYMYEQMFGGRRGHFPPPNCNVLLVARFQKLTY